MAGKKGQDDGTFSPAKAVARVSVLFLWIAVILSTTVLLVVFAANELETNGPPEIVLPLVVIAGVVALLASLAIAAATFGLFNLSDKSQALGLPAGSIQAVIALSLILIFAVVALYASGKTGAERFESKGLTPTEYKAIPPDQLVATNSTEAEGKVTYDVVRSVEDPAAKDINIQLLTTVSTLVVAVAGFYFGSKSVQEGSAAALEAAGPTRTLTLVEPTSPHAMHPGSTVKVKLQSVPPAAQLRWSLQGDGEGRLVRLESGEFEYTAGKSMMPDTSATLHFEQVDDPKVDTALTIEFNEPPNLGPKGKAGSPAGAKSTKAASKKKRAAAKGKRRKRKSAS